MTHPSKMTKAELLAQIAERDEALAAVSDERDGLSREVDRLASIPAPHAVPEAEALAGCVRSLNSIPTIRARNSYTSDSDERDKATIRRVLVALGDRYGIALIEHQTEPCSRAHLDEFRGVSVVDLLGGTR